MRILLTAIRRSLGRYFAPLLLAIEALNLFAHGRGWTITWESASETGATIMMLIGPLAAAVGAAEGVELSRKGTVMRAVGRRAQWRLSLLRFAALSVWAIGCHLVGLAVITVMTAARHHSIGSLDWAVTAVSLEVLLAHIAVGVAVGVWIPRLITPPALAVAMYALVPAFGMPLRLVIAGAGMTPMLGEQPRTDLLAVQAVWFACAAAVALLLAGGIGALRLGVAAAVAAIMIWAGPFAVGLGPDTVQPQAHPDLLCSGSSPRVCASTDLPGSLEPLQRVAGPLTRAAHALAPSEHIDTVVGLTWIAPQPATVSVGVNVHPPYVNSDEAAAGFAASMAGCWDEVPDRALHDLDIATRFLLHTADLSGQEDLGPAGARPPTLTAAHGALSRMKAACR